jgi:hypothetical protein
MSRLNYKLNALLLDKDTYQTIMQISNDTEIKNTTVVRLLLKYALSQYTNSSEGFALAIVQKKGKKGVQDKKQWTK